MTTTNALPIKTTCPYCGVGCGVVIEYDSANNIRVKGDPEHPANLGRLCSKGSALAETLGLDGRLLAPEIAGIPASWDQALDHVAAQFRNTIAEHGPDSVAFYVSGQLLTEDYYVANKLMKGYIGSGNIDTNSRLCMSSSVAGHKRAFGEDIVPGCYQDFEMAELIVLVGSNLAWCHPVLFQRIAAAKQNNPRLKVVSIDPRRTASCDIADLHLALKPGTDVLLFNGLLHALRKHGQLDFAYLEQHVSGFAAALDAAKVTGASLPETASACGLKEEDLSRFYHWFGRTEKTVTAWSQGVNQSSSGSDKVNAIINVHLATGRIGKPGMGPFSLTGQPNAMGGREVGGLANQLAAHMDFDSPGHWDIVSTFWKAPNLARRPGFKAVDLFNAVADGRIKALWIIATNPVVSLPDVRHVRRALGACPFVVVSDCEDNTDLKAYAHVRLPALGWGEKDGTVTNSERRISRQRSFLPAPGEARPDWWALTQVAHRMGFEQAFAYQHPQQIFVEFARLSGYRNDGMRLFNLSGLQNLDVPAYNTLQPIQWPIKQPNGRGCRRLFHDGLFSHDDSKARMLGLTPQPAGNPTCAAFPFVLNTGRIRDQWHTMTRTARSPRLNQHMSEPYAELHPDDAEHAGLKDGELAHLKSRWGDALARVRVSADQQRGSVFMPMHWSDRFARHGLVNALVNPVVDPASGEPEFKHTPVSIEVYRPAWHGFAIAREALSIDAAEYCAQQRGDGYFLYELAGNTLIADTAGWAKPAFCRTGHEYLEYADMTAGRYRCATLHNNILMACLFISCGRQLPDRAWLIGLLTTETTLTSTARMAVLAGKSPVAREDPGRIVCACYSIGANTLSKAIREFGYSSTEQLGQALNAGTGCGSCLPELRTLLENTRRSL
ncbi:molybdopterin-dependent oxidoreductase [Candidatus Methylospira mobilis]|uniref:nitrate reductase (cytochrome) n=1 Tax=Candidatus Methylospira mobilis TaxID=1808979 RepID=A0A5Q0BNX3_9GAMM|nr:nitrate reductase [Candidatus Methylospira mobilis]QFY43951.1 molybdopterin-dependent oxidoreductase [Candidatus Methylospira mobilis]